MDKKYFQNKYRIDSIRLKEWDYSIPWWYFITTNSKDNIIYFGDIVNNKMILNDFGRILEKCWLDIPKHYSEVELDYYAVMPNHFHGIIILNSKLKETGHAPSLHKKHSLSNIVGSFKSGCTKQIRDKGGKDFQWQERFYDRIIRNEKELYQIRNYIYNNPLRWEIEKELPENLDIF